MDLDTIIRQFNTLTENPESYLSHNEAMSTNLKCLLKSIHDANQQRNIEKIISNIPRGLSKLIVDHFDAEQIWQQIELNNIQFFCDSTPKVTKYTYRDNVPIFAAEGSQNNMDNVILAREDSSDCYTSSDESNIHIPSKERSDSEEEEEEGSDILQEKSTRKRKCSKVDDDFFNLQEMEDFLDNEDKREMLNTRHDQVDSAESDNETNSKEIDLFAAMSDLDEMEDDEDKGPNKNPKYADFFAKTNEISDVSEKKIKRNKYLEQLSNSAADSPEIEQSAFALRQERLGKKIAALETIAVAAKPWQLKGEISAESRPQNSLLENVLEFDMSTRPAPVITEETTVHLEVIIRQRIQERIWDSVQRKQKPIEDIPMYKKQLVMDSEKSKLSLAQIYEQDYLLKQQDNEPSEVRDQDENPLHVQIGQMMSAVISKLDALSNYHFTPKLVAPELKVVTNLPAISMEEVAPLATSDAALLAPEEVQTRTRGKKGAAPLGLAERTCTDKKRQRRMKKRKQTLHAVRATAKHAIPTNKHTKEKAAQILGQLTKEKNVDKMTDDSFKAVKSSTAFFEQLQNQVKSTIKGKLSKEKTCEQAKRLKL